ncbi:hypothetical protein J7I93_19495 [Bacillus sp. ISL-47]|uniref:hypothetical protein n=1 Tax=Bacillus sp. ISL-47 TaxID=2819130 RepID=UPI001BE900BE|nr:hypothetical protein [Bacillus sp. ISL-47]MBT2690340.1 hypothetical protein [Bacillus sp. ISL-47]MBT2709210.1 hypothetical protein [Pseudomonas sp. ISL-84]
MNNPESYQPKNTEEPKRTEGSLLESMMEPMDQLSKVAPENTERKTNKNEVQM